MRKRASFLAPRFIVLFSHGKDSHTLQGQRISSAADGKQMFLSHSQCTFSNATAWKWGCQLWKTTPQMFYPTWRFTAHIVRWGLVFKSFCLLSAGQRRDEGMETDQDPPWIMYEHNKKQTLTCTKPFILALIAEGWVPHFSCRAPVGIKQ